MCTYSFVYLAETLSWYKDEEVRSIFVLYLTKSQLSSFMFWNVCQSFTHFFLVFEIYLKEKEQKYQLRLEGCRIRDLEGGWLARKAAFAIFNPDLK